MRPSVLGKPSGGFIPGANLVSRSKAVLASSAGATNKLPKHVLKILSYLEQDTKVKCTNMHWIATRQNAEDIQLPLLLSKQSLQRFYPKQNNSDSLQYSDYFASIYSCPLLQPPAPTLPWLCDPFLSSLLLFSQPHPPTPEQTSLPGHQPPSWGQDALLHVVSITFSARCEEWNIACQIARRSVQSCWTSHQEGRPAEEGSSQHSSADGLCWQGPQHPHPQILLWAARNHCFTGPWGYVSH